MPTRIAPRAALPITPEDPLPAVATGTHRTPRCVTTGVTAASAPSAEETPSGVLTATFTPAGVLTTALPSIRSPPISPSVKRNTILDPAPSSMRPKLPRLISALLPLAQATAILLSVNTDVPVMALLSLTVTEPVTINWPTCWEFPFVSAFVFFVFLAARVEPVLNTPKEASANDSRVTVTLRVLGERSDIINSPDCLRQLKYRGVVRGDTKLTSVSLFFQTLFFKDFTGSFQRSSALQTLIPRQSQP